MSVFCNLGFASLRELYRRTKQRKGKALGAINFFKFKRKELQTFQRTEHIFFYGKQLLKFFSFYNKIYADIY